MGFQGDALHEEQAAQNGAPILPGGLGTGPYSQEQQCQQGAAVSACTTSENKEQLCQHVPQAQTRSNCVSMYHKRKQGATVPHKKQGHDKQPCYTRSRVMTNNRATQEAGS